MRRASSSTGLIMKAIVAFAWLAVLLASDDDAGVVSVAAVRPIRTDVGRGYGSWPELVGMPSSEAKKKICEYWSCDYVHVIPAGAYVTMDHDIRRVRVFVDSNGKVARVPRVG